MVIPLLWIYAPACRAPTVDRDGVAQLVGSLGILSTRTFLQERDGLESRQFVN